MGLLSKLRRKREESRERINKFKQDIENKNWGKSLERLIIERNLEPFEKQDSHTMYIFFKSIKDRWDIKASYKEMRWAWGKILETLIEREKRRKKREIKKIEKKILEDIKNNINPSLYSLVKKYRGNFSKGGKKFREELIKIYKEDKIINHEVASHIWNKIAKKIIDERTEKIKENLSKGKHFHLLYMVYTYGGLWKNKGSEAKETFLRHLEGICGMKISEREASIIWNWIREHTRAEMRKMMQRGIDLSTEIYNLGSERVSNRINAAIKLGIFGDKRAVRPLLEALKDRNIEVNIAAAEALGEIEDTRGMDDVRKLLMAIEKEINKIDKKIDRIKNKINKRGSYVGYSEEIKEIEWERDYYYRFYKRVERVLKRLKKKKFQQIAKLADGKYKELDWQDFQDRVIEVFNGIPSNKKVADMGIDGVTSDGIPIQVKQSERVGRNVVDNFETALRRYYPSNKKILKGIIVAFSFTKGAYEEAQRARLEDSIKIDLITVEELF